MVTKEPCGVDFVPICSALRTCCGFAVTAATAVQFPGQASQGTPAGGSPEAALGVPPNPPTWRSECLSLLPCPSRRPPVVLGDIMLRLIIIIFYPPPCLGPSVTWSQKPHRGTLRPPRGISSLCSLGSLLDRNP